ncbi:hypothetical protein METHB2_400037 [Candidatus Methylobacter favarea]|uniref:Uncharacterized protein n=1 Tax=Candidatus Methylobacter favarea TaxID=2707345 RepID=A0A8S0YAA7_9GAMM|nr:hypothetical protein METHB2_400037 [Candidatus Methylobacter favarea]
MFLISKSALFLNIYILITAITKPVVFVTLKKALLRHLIIYYPIPWITVKKSTYIDALKVAF